jgi:hypothetical protein
MTDPPLQSAFLDERRRSPNGKTLNAPRTALKSRKMSNGFLGLVLGHGIDVLPPLLEGLPLFVCCVGRDVL